MSQTLPENGTVQVTEIALSKSDYERMVGIYAIRATVFLNQMNKERKDKEQAIKERDALALVLNANQIYAGRLESMVEEFLDEGSTVYNEGLTPKQMELLSIIRKKMKDRKTLIDKLKPNGKLFDELALAK